MTAAVNPARGWAAERAQDRRAPAAQRVALAAVAYGSDIDGIRVWEPTEDEMHAALGERLTPYSLTEALGKARIYRLIGPESTARRITLTWGRR